VVNVIALGEQICIGELDERMQEDYGGFQLNKGKVTHTTPEEVLTSRGLKIIYKYITATREEKCGQLKKSREWTWQLEWEKVCEQRILGLGNEGPLR